MTLAIIQILAWIAAGYNIKAHNYWASAACALVAFLISVATVLINMTRNLNDKHTN